MPGIEHGVEQGARDDALRLYGVQSTKLNVTGDTGWPDVIFWIRGGRPLLIEFKAPGEEPDPHQYAKHVILLYQGYEVIVSDTKEEALKHIAKAVDAATVPEARLQVLARTLLSSVISRSRAGQDKHRARRNKNPPA